MNYPTPARRPPIGGKNRAHKKKTPKLQAAEEQQKTSGGEFESCDPPTHLVCEDSACKLWVVMRTIEHFNYRSEDEKIQDDDGGWELQMTIDLLSSIRDDLRKPAGIEPPQPMKGGA